MMSSPQLNNIHCGSGCQLSLVTIPICKMQQEELERKNKEEVPKWNERNKMFLLIDD